MPQLVKVCRKWRAGNTHVGVLVLTAAFGELLVELLSLLDELVAPPFPFVSEETPLLEVEVDPVFVGKLLVVSVLPLVDDVLEDVVVGGGLVGDTVVEDEVLEL